MFSCLCCPAVYLISLLCRFETMLVAAVELITWIKSCQPSSSTCSFPVLSLWPSGYFCFSLESEMKSHAAVIFSGAWEKGRNACRSHFCRFTKQSLSLRSVECVTDFTTLEALEFLLICCRCVFLGGPAGCRYMWSIHSKNHGLRGRTSEFWAKIQKQLCEDILVHFM